MSTTYIILSRSPCIMCEGTGQIPNPIWLQYAVCRAGGEIPDSGDSWFADRHIDPDCLPEDIECPQCAGTAFYDEEIRLTTALRKLGIEVINEPGD